MKKRFVDPVVAEKHKVQERLARRAHYNVHEFARVVHEEAVKASKEYGFPLKYAGVPSVAEPAPEYGIKRKIRRIKARSEA